MILYTEDHEWIKEENGLYKIGITDFAQQQLGDIVFVELPEIGNEYEKGEEFGVIESVKAASELYMPVSGEIAEVNEDLNDNPALINEDPFKHWIIKVSLNNSSQLGDLMNLTEYLKVI